jgi:hypothetical protein
VRILIIEDNKTVQPILYGIADQELTRAGLDLSNAIAEYNKAQYSLLVVLGGLSAPAESRPKPATSIPNR